MSILSSIFLGLVQGVAEFLPISSSGHLSLFQHFFGMASADGNLFFDVLLDCYMAYKGMLALYQH